MLSNIIVKFAFIFTRKFIIFYFLFFLAFFYGIDYYNAAQQRKNPEPLLEKEFVPKISIKKGLAYASIYSWDV